MNSNILRCEGKNGIHRAFEARRRVGREARDEVHVYLEAADAPYHGEGIDDILRCVLSSDGGEYFIRHGLWVYAYPGDAAGPQHAELFFGNGVRAASLYSILP